MKRNVLLRVIALLLAVMTLIPMIACADQIDTPADTTAGGDNGDASNAATTAAPETTRPYDENGDLKDTRSTVLYSNFSRIPSPPISTLTITSSTFWAGTHPCRTFTLKWTRVTPLLTVFSYVT